jgi:nitroreductase
MEVLFKALQLAPSANNSQNWKFVFVSDQNVKQRLVPACFNQGFIADCSYFIAGVANPSLKWHMVDITIAMTQFALQATELGYGTCWIGAFSENRVKEILGVPENKKVIICMTFGLPKEKPLFRSRKEIEKFVCLNRYGEIWNQAQDIN